MPSPLPNFPLRLPPELKLALAAAALQNYRSLNAEIVHRLRESLREQYRPGP